MDEGEPNRKAFTRAQQSVERETLLGDVRMNDLDLTSRDHQQRYADTTAKLESQSAIIQDSQRMTEDTIAITTEALAELDRQRSVMERSRNRVCGPSKQEHSPATPASKLGDVKTHVCGQTNSLVGSTRLWTAPVRS